MPRNSVVFRLGENLTPLMTLVAVITPAAIARLRPSEVVEVVYRLIRL